MTCRVPLFSFRIKPLALAIATIFSPFSLLAAPTGGVVSSGVASITQTGRVTSVNQSTQKATINWQGFSIAASETVNFNQPSASSITLNRVIGNEKSVINGALNANGQVFLINSNGVLIGKGASVNTSGFLASTLNLSDDDFNSGNYVFKSNGTAGSIINLGTITANDGGYVALLGNSVTNEGVISATKGTVAMSAGDKITLNFNGDSLVNVTLDEGTLNALVQNKQAIYADGGKVILTAKAADEVLASQVNNSGVIQARTIDDLKGSIQLYAYNGTATVDGTLDASAPVAGDGGNIETSGSKVKVADSAYVTTLSAKGTSGTWLIDPDGYTIGSGGDMSGTALGSALNNGSVTIASTSGSGSDGDVTVNDAVSWSGNTTLTLTATNDININNAITASGSSAGVALNYGGDYYIRTKASYSGTTTDSSGNLVAQTDTSGGTYGSINFSACQDASSCANTSLKINGTSYALIGNMGQLDGLDGYNAATASGTVTTVSGNYALAHDLDASGTTYSSALISEFSGTLAGLGHVVDGLTISTSDSNVGLIGKTASGSTTALREIGVTNFTLTTTGAGDYYGALLGASNSKYLTVLRSYSTGSIGAYNGKAVGGLIGATSNSGYSTISDSYSSVNLSAYIYGGGLIGYAGGAIGSNGYYTSINNSHASGSITGKSGSYASGQKLGGLVGTFSGHGSVANSYATGNVTSHSSLSDANTEIPGSYIGGLVGSFDAADANYSNSVTKSFSTGEVIGSYYVGGLIGYVNATSTSSFLASVTYATGNVTATSTNTTISGSPETDVGGLIGYGNYLSIKDSYATGNVTEALTEGLFAGTVGKKTANYVGGLVGNGANTTIANSFATGNVITSSNASTVGGLAGSATTIQNSYATGQVSGAQSFVGGLAGIATTISNSYSTGNVSAQGNYVGGLAGSISSGSISNSYATGNVSGLQYVGGLAGYGVSGSISDSYATGSVTGLTYVGGLAGTIKNVSGSWANGSVTKTNANGISGALVGQLYSAGVIVDSYWNATNNTLSNAVGKLGTNTTVSATSLSGNTSKDIAYYANGTINQVLAARAEAAAIATEKAVLQERSTTASAVSASIQRESVTPAVSAEVTGSTSAGSSISNQIILTDALNFGVSIKSVTVDGVRYDLSDTASTPEPEGASTGGFLRGSGGSDATSLPATGRARSKVDDAGI